MEDKVLEMIKLWPFVLPLRACDIIEAVLYAELGTRVFEFGSAMREAFGGVPNNQSMNAALMANVGASVSNGIVHGVLTKRFSRGSNEWMVCRE